MIPTPEKPPVVRVYARAWVLVFDPGRQLLLEQVAREEGAYLARSNPFGVQIIADRDVILGAVKAAGRMAAVYEAGRLRALFEAFQDSEYNPPCHLDRYLDVAEAIAAEGEAETWEITDWGEYHERA